MMRRKAKNKFPKTMQVLLEALKDFAIFSADALGGFITSAGSSRILARNMKMARGEFRSTFQNLKRAGYVRKINENQFLITPKAIRRVRMIEIEESSREEKEWDGILRIVVFDVPEGEKAKRNILRSFLKRVGFIGIQNSVFVSPFADFDKLAIIRADLKIEKYVTFFEAKCAKTEDNSLLLKKLMLSRRPENQRRTGLIDKTCEALCSTF